MNAKEAQEKIMVAIKEDPQNVIEKAIYFRPHIRAVVADLRNVPGPASGVAATALKYALKGNDNATTEANMIAFADLI